MTAQDVEPGVWSAKAVAAVLFAAGRVFMSQPLGPRDLPMAVRAAWPATAQDPWFGYRNDEAPRVTRLKPNAAQIAAADTAIAWLMWIESPRDRRVVAARVFGARWKAVARMDGRAAVYLRGEFWGRHMAAIARRLTARKFSTDSDLTNLTKFC